MRTNPHFEYEQDELDMEVHESAHRGTQAVLLTVTPAMQQHGAGGCEVRVCRICSILFEISPPACLCLVCTEHTVFRQILGIVCAGEQLENQ